MTRSTLDGIADFERELQAFGLALKGGAICDGVIHRLPDLHHHRKRNDVGWYWLRELDNGLLIGEAGSWLEGRGKITWNSRGVSHARLPRADQAAIALAKAARVAEAERLHRQAADTAARDWAEAKPCTSHPYLERKDVRSYGLRLDGSGRLLIPVTDLDGNLRGLQRIDANGDKRFTFGTDRSTALAFILGELEAATVVVVEGYATGATIHEATGLPVVVAFDANGLKRIAKLLRDRLPATALIFAGDHDLEAKGGTGQKAARAAAVVAGGAAILPPTEGHDWNDHAALHGLEDVRHRIIKAAGLYDAPATVTLAEGTERLDAAVSQFMVEGTTWRDLPDDQREATPPPASLINATMGSGKSHQVRRVAGDFLKANTTGATATFVPLHKLAADQAEAFTADTGLEASIWRGMSQQDPDRPEGDLMCLEPELSGAAQSAGVNVSEVCKVCPKRNDCGYRRQRQQAGRYWLLPHQMLFTRKPREIAAPAFVVIDEAFHDAGMVENVRLAVSTLEGDLSDVPHAGDRDLLQASRHALLSALASIKPATGKRAYLTRAALEGAGLDVSTAREAARIEWTRKPKPKLGGDVPDMVADLEALGGRFSTKVPTLWRLVADFLEGDDDHTPAVELEPDAALRGGDGFGAMLWLHYRRDVHTSWRAPTLILDGTARPEIVRHFFPHLGATVQIDIEAPHQHVTWVRRSFAKSRLTQSKRASPSRNRANANTLEDARRYIEAMAGRYRGRAMYDSADVLVICNQDVEDLLRAGHGLPANVVVDHFNNTRGRNDWEHVRAVIVVGRTLPGPATIHRQAERMAGRPLDQADQLVTAMRWSICEAELLQNIARARGIRRSPGNPLDVFILGDVALPLQIDRVMSWAEAQPTPLELMAARGVVPACDPDRLGYWPLVAAVLPDLFPTVQAAKDAGRSHGGIRLMDISLLDVSHCERAKAKPHGARYAVPVLVDPGRRLELAAILDLGDQPAIAINAETTATAFAAISEITAAGPSEAPTPAGYSIPAASVVPSTSPPAAVAVPVVEPPAAVPAFSAQYAREADPWGDYAGGIMPDDVRDQVRDRWRASGLRQDQVAERVGISRPQFANALQGRFGLSADAAARLRAVVAALPVEQAALL